MRSRRCTTPILCTGRSRCCPTILHYVPVLQFYLPPSGLEPVCMNRLDMILGSATS